MKPLFLLLFLTFLGLHRSFAQKLPREFVEGISKWVLPAAGSANEALDVYSVILVLSPDGSVERTIFSEGTPQDLKAATNERISIARIKLTPLKQWWAKYSKDNHISEDTYIGQSVFARFEDTDKLQIPVNKFAEMYWGALSFGDQTAKLEKNVNIIWLPPVIHRYEHVKIVD